jgi:hypothetical protein
LFREENILKRETEGVGDSIKMYTSGMCFEGRGAGSTVVFVVSCVEVLGFIEMMLVLMKYSVFVF